MSTRSIRSILNLQDTELRTELKENWFTYALISPTFLFIIAVLWVPFFRGIWISFHRWRFLQEALWVGLSHYKFLLNADIFWTSVVVTFFYSLATIAHVGLGLLAALIVANINRFKSVLSGSYLLAYTMPPVVTGTLWLYLLSPDWGPIFKYLQMWGIIEETIYWGTNGGLALAVITLVSSWTFWPFVFLILVATRMTIPESHYESAKVYGAGLWDQFRHITLPQMRSGIIVAGTLRMIWNLAKVSQPFQITQGGPGYSTTVLGIYLYRLAFNQGRFGRAYAVGVILFLITLVLILFFLREFERGSEEVDI